MKFSSLLLSLCVAAGARCALAGTVTWTGGNGWGYEWIDSCWDTGAKPGPDDIARFVDVASFQGRIESGKIQSIGLKQDEEVLGLRFENAYGCSVQGSFKLTLSSIFAADTGRATTNHIQYGNIAMKTNQLHITSLGTHILRINEPINESSDERGSILRDGDGTVLIDTNCSLNHWGGSWFKEGTTIYNSVYAPVSRGNLTIGGGDSPAVFEMTASSGTGLMNNSNDLRILRGGALVMQPQTTPRTMYLEYVEVDHGLLDIGGATIQPYNAATTDRHQTFVLTGGVVSNANLNCMVFGDFEVLISHAADIPSVIAGGTLAFSGYPGFISAERGTAPVDLVIGNRLQGNQPIRKTGTGICVLTTNSVNYAIGKDSEVRAGALYVNNATDSGLGTNNWVVAAGATLGGTGTTYGGVDPDQAARGLRGNLTFNGAAANPAVCEPGSPAIDGGAWMCGTFNVGTPEQTNNVTFASYGALRCHITRGEGAACLAVDGLLTLSGDDILEIEFDARKRPIGRHTLATFTNGLVKRFADVKVNGVSAGPDAVRYRASDGTVLSANAFGVAGYIEYIIAPENTVLFIR